MDPPWRNQTLCLGRCWPLLLREVTIRLEFLPPNYIRWAIRIHIQLKCTIQLQLSPIQPRCETAWMEATAARQCSISREPMDSWSIQPRPTSYYFNLSTLILGPMVETSKLECSNFSIRRSLSSLISVVSITKSEVQWIQRQTTYMEMPAIMQRCLVPSPSTPRSTIDPLLAKWALREPTLWKCPQTYQTLLVRTQAPVRTIGHLLDASRLTVRRQAIRTAMNDEAACARPRPTRISLSLLEVVGWPKVRSLRPGWLVRWRRRSSTRSRKFGIL